MSVGQIAIDRNLNIWKKPEIVGIEQWKSPLGSLLLKSLYPNNSKRRKLPGKVFHYTSIDVLEKVLLNSSGCPLIRFSSVLGMNDQTELSFGLEIIRKQAEMTNCAYLLGIIERINDSLGDFGACCFSENRDEIPSWLIYGDKGRGCSLGFDTKTLFSVHGYFVKCIYTDSEQIVFVRNFIKNIENWVTNFSETEKSDPELENILVLLASVALALKPFKWAYEKEWRLIYKSRLSSINLRNGQLSKVSDQVLQGLDDTQQQSIRVLADSEIHGIENLIIDELNPIREIVLGNGVGSETENIISFLLDELQLTNVALSRSECQIC